MYRLKILAACACMAGFGLFGTWHVVRRHPAACRARKAAAHFWHHATEAAVGWVHHDHDHHHHDHHDHHHRHGEAKSLRKFLEDCEHEEEHECDYDYEYEYDYDNEYEYEYDYEYDYYDYSGVYEYDGEDGNVAEGWSFEDVLRPPPAPFEEDELVEGEWAEADYSEPELESGEDGGAYDIYVVVEEEPQDVDGHENYEGGVPADVVVGMPRTMEGEIDVPPAVEGEEGFPPPPLEGGVPAVPPPPDFLALPALPAVPALPGDVVVGDDVAVGFVLPTEEEDEMDVPPPPPRVEGEVFAPPPPLDYFEVAEDYLGPQDYHRGGYTGFDGEEDEDDRQHGNGSMAKEEAPPQSVPGVIV